MNKQQLILDTSALAESDNVGAYLRSADGTLLTHTDVGGKKSLDVNVANSVTVTATDLDIRNLAFATDKVDASGSVVALDAPTLAALENITVSATDFDIRNLDYSQDNVAIKGSTGNQLVVNADGSINVLADISITSGSDKAEDAAHSSGDIGTYVLAVRQDTLANSTSADGDYGSFKINSTGALYVEVAHFDIEIKQCNYVSLLQYCVDHAGEDYAYLQNVGIVMARAFNLNYNPFQSGINCSEAIAGVLKHEGFELPFNKDLVAPRDLFQLLQSKQSN